MLGGTGSSTACCEAVAVQQLDRDLETLTLAKAAWARMPVERKIAALETIKRNLHALAGDWVAASARAKGLLPGSPLEGEEWLSGPWAVLYALNRYVRTLQAISRRGEPSLPHARRRPDGRIVLDVFPRTPYDRLLLSGVTAAVWMQRGLSEANVRDTAAAFYRIPNPPGTVALVLGAGNIASIAPLDVLYKMLFDGSVCMLKLNPVNAYLGPVLERIFEPLVTPGFLRFSYGGAQMGEYLCGHEAIEEIHVTGSSGTHESIAAGPGSGKRITSELGNVSPTIVVPGPWTSDDIAFQAQNIATQKAHNAGFNCIAAQVLILPGDWKHSAALRDAIAGVFAGMEQRPEYYPGATERRQQFAGEPSALRCIVRAGAERLDEAAFRNEAFCGVLFCVEMPGGTEQYLRDAVEFANRRLHGTLGANLIAHPATLRKYASAIDGAVEELRYGCIGINAWTGVGFLLCEAPWGAYPANAQSEMQSGTGVVHNSYFLQGTEKTVVRAPFAPFPRSFRTGEYTLLPKPPWFVTNREQSGIGRALCDFEFSPSPAKAARIAALALRG